MARRAVRRPCGSDFSATPTLQTVKPVRNRTRCVHLAEPLAGRLRLVAGLADRLQVAVIVRAAIGFGLDVVNLRSLGHTTFLKTGLTQSVIAIENPFALALPRGAIAARRCAARSIFTLAPVGRLVRVRIAVAISDQRAAARLLAWAQWSRWHDE